MKCKKWILISVSVPFILANNKLKKRKVNLTLSVSVPFFLSQSGAEFNSGKKQIKKIKWKKMQTVILTLSEYHVYCPVVRHRYGSRLSKMCKKLIWLSLFQFLSFTERA